MIQDIFNRGYKAYCDKYMPSPEQRKAAYSIMNCKTGKLGYYTMICDDCGVVFDKPCSCRNRHCPSCQSLNREKWIDARKSEVFDSSQYFHIVVNVPAQLRPIFMVNQKLLYSLLFQCSSDSIIELSKSERGMGGTPCITQALHTWGQQMNYHPHLHAIVSGIGLSSLNKLVKCEKDFLFPIQMFMKLFKGKFLYYLNELYKSNSLKLLEPLLGNQAWINLLSKLYEIDWAPFVKETFDGNGDAVEYIGRYINRIAISNNRIKEITDTHVTFSFYNYRTEKTDYVTITIIEFIRRYLSHVLPKGMQKIRHSGLLNNRFKYRNLQLLAILLKEYQRKALLKDLNTAEILMLLWKIDISVCPECHGHNLKLASLPFHQRL